MLHRLAESLASTPDRNTLGGDARFPLPVMRPLPFEHRSLLAAVIAAATKP